MWRRTHYRQGQDSRNADACPSTGTDLDGRDIVFRRTRCAVEPR
ncbi:MAG: hypothetical protein PHP71_10225 [Methanosarcina sp.]|nr:hypothetical protein [Methanosarcina sp.]